LPTTSRREKKIRPDAAPSEQRRQSYVCGGRTRAGKRCQATILEQKRGRRTRGHMDHEPGELGPLGRKV